MAVLFLGTVLSRLPFRSRYLNSWDSFNFALALERYDVWWHRPHPPGYPVYVAAGRVLHSFVGEANASLVALGILASGAAVAFLYGLAREFASRRVAVAAATLFALAPVFLFNGVIALSYACEAAVSTGFAWLAWRMWARPSVRGALLLGVVWSLAVGFRQSLLFFLSPLAALVILAHPWSPRDLARRVLAAAASALATTLAWFLPMVNATTGGYRNWRIAVEGQSKGLVFADTLFNRGWPSAWDKIERLGYYLHFELVLLWVMGLLLVAACLLSRRPARWTGRAPMGRVTLFLAVWALPSVFFYATVYNGGGRHPPGYVLVFLPALYLTFVLVADAFISAIESGPRWPLPRAARALPAALLLVPAPFLALEWDGFLDQEVRGNDEWAARWDGLRAEYLPNETAIVSWFHWGHTRWYFPEYPVWGYFEQPEGRFYLIGSRDHDEVLPPGYPDVLTYPTPPGLRQVILFDFQLAGENGATRRVEPNVTVVEDHLASGWRVLLFRTDDAHPTLESYFVGPTSTWAS